MGKRILITGITGFAGSHLADWLLTHEENVKLFGLKRVNSSMRNIHHCKELITWIDGDLCDQSSLISVIKISKPDEIYHLGALSWVTPSWEMPAIYMQTNAIGTIHLFEAMRNQGSDARVLVSCTPEEYGDVPESSLPITESTKLHPINPYAASKVAQDMVCLTWGASYGFKVIRTRAFNHEGPRRDIHGANASFAFQIARIEAGLQPPIINVGNLDAVRNFTDVRDIVRGYHLAMGKCVPGELYLIGRRETHTMKECLEFLISRSSKKGIQYRTEPTRVRPTELLNFTGEFSKFEKATGWSPEINFESTMDSVLDYWRNFLNQKLY